MVTFQPGDIVRPTREYIDTCLRLCRCALGHDTAIVVAQTPFGKRVHLNHYFFDGGAAVYNSGLPFTALELVERPVTLTCADLPKLPDGWRWYYSDGTLELQVGDAAHSYMQWIGTEHDAVTKALNFLTQMGRVQLATD